MSDFFIETEILPKTFFSFEQDIKKKYKIKAVILLQEGLKDIYSSDLMGDSTKNWVRDALSGYKVVEVKIKNKNEYMDEVSKVVKDEDYIIALYGDTPLVKAQSIHDAVQYITSKSLDLLRLPKGSIFKVKALKKKKFDLSSEANFLRREEFFSVFNDQTKAHAREVLRQRILDENYKNGVDILMPNSVYIEKDVVISKGVKIYSGNILKGKTIIKEGVVLRENNIIDGSIVSENSTVTSSVLINAKIKKGSNIKAFSVIIGDKK